MKRCQVCHFLADDKAPTCPKCGEASWAACPPVHGMKGATLILDEQVPPTVPDVASLTYAELEALTAPSTTTHAKKGKR